MYCNRTWGSTPTRKLFRETRAGRHTQQKSAANATHKIPQTAARDEETPAAPFPACVVLFPLVVGTDAPDVLTGEEPPELADAVTDPELAGGEADPELADGATEPALDAPGTAVISGWSTGWLATSHPLTRS